MILMKNPTSRWKAACGAAVFILGRVGQPTRPEVGPVKVRGGGVGPVRGGGIRPHKARLHGHGTNGIPVIQNSDQQSEAEADDNANVKGTLAYVLNHLTEAVSNLNGQTEEVLMDVVDHEDNGDVEIHGGLENSVNVAISKPSDNSEALIDFSKAGTHIGDRRRGSHPSKDADSASLLDTEDTKDTKPFTFVDGMDRLKAVSHLLRSDKNVNLASLLVEVRDVAQALLSGLLLVQEHYEKGDEDGAITALKSTMGNLEYFAKASRGMKAKRNNKGLDILESSSLDETHPYDLEEISNARLAEFLQPQVFDEQIEIVRDTVNILENLDLSLLSSQEVDKATTHKNFDSSIDLADDEHWQEREVSQETFEFESNAFDFGFAGSQTTFSQPRGQFRPQNFFDHSSLHNLLYQHRAAASNQYYAQKLSKISSLFENNQALMARHEVRMNALGDTCRSTCTTVQCNLHNCEKLFGCVQKMSAYDLAVLTAGGFVDTTITSENYANFTVSVDNLSLFDADGNIEQKLAQLKADAVGHTDTPRCKAVLEKLYTGCDPTKVSCSDPNTESFQVSIDQVCNAVETKTKLLFEVIGDEFDGFVDEGVAAKRHPLSYDVCLEFVAAFDRLYTARPAEYTLPNPMRKNENVILDGKTWLDIFQHTKFPVGAWFRKDVNTGVVAKSFSGYSDIYFFTIRNPVSGKALSSACGDGMLDILTHDPSDQNQHFYFSDDGALKPRKCSSKAVSVPGSCRDFAVFKLENLNSLEATAKFVKVGIGGTISSGKCPGFFLVSAVDAVRQVKDPSEIRVRLEHRKSGKYWTFGNSFNLQQCTNHVATGEYKRVQLQDLDTMLAPRVKYSLFKIIKFESGQFEIRSRRCNQVSIRATCSENAPVEVTEQEVQKWRIRADGTLSPVGCEDFAVGFVGDATGVFTDLKLMQIFPSNPNQQFTAVAIDPIIRPPGEGDHLQSWQFQNIEPGYSYAVTPGFPGRNLGRDGDACTEDSDCECNRCAEIVRSRVTQHVCQPRLGGGHDCTEDADCISNSCRTVRDSDGEKECTESTNTPVTYPERIMLESARDKELAKYAMHSCDASMKYLLGSQMSLGTLRAIVSDVQDGSERMPGKCCFDTPTTNDDYLGLEFDPAVMNCTTPGFWHLGISKEVCNNVGGKWFRSPCTTLKRCIDARPKLFDPDTSQTGTCQEVLKRLSVGFVSSRSQHANYTFQQTPSGCSSFCRSLPDDSNQVGMGTVRKTTAEMEDEVNCVCLYNNGKVPDKVPDYAARSPPKFSLISNGKALGISHEILDCTADEISIEAQDFVNSPRQQLYLSYEGQLVSAYCPQRVLTAFGNGNLKAMAPYYHLNHVTKQQQQWVYNANSGKISNANHQELFISSINSDDSIDSYFFSLMNQGSSLMLGVDGNGCAGGQKIVLQKEIAGSLNQKFKLGDNGQIISMKCPSYAITTPLCTMDTALQLQAHAGENVALGKSATMSSVSVTNRGVSLSAERAVDGDTSTYSRTRNSEDAWWRVDLGREYTITGIVLRNRDHWRPDRPDVTRRLRNFDIIFKDPNLAEVGTRIHQHQSFFPTKNFVVSDIRAQYVEVSMPILEGGVLRRDNYLTISEVEVYARENVALNKEATMSSIYNTHLSAGRGVDGDTTTYFQTQKGVDAWWQVDLGREYTITGILLENRRHDRDDIERSLRNFDIQLLDSNGAEVKKIHQDAAIYPDLTKHFAISNKRAQYVKISMPVCCEGGGGLRTDNHLHIAEVEVYAAPDNRWQLGADGKIKSLDCPSKFIGTGATSQAEFIVVTSTPPSLPLPVNPNNFENDTAINSTSPYGNASYSERQVPGVGTEIVLSSSGMQHDFFTWSQKNQRFTDLIGPYYFVNGENLVMGIEEGKCTDGMTLNSQVYNPNKLSQQFYIGNYGTIYSAQCEGGVISMEGSCDEENLLKVRIYENEESMKWEYKSNGVLRSAKCQAEKSVISVEVLAGHMRANPGVGIRLTLPGTASQESKKWKRENTRLLSAQSGGSLWNQKWTIDFVDKDYDSTSLIGELLGTRDTGNTAQDTRCHEPNPAFSATFEEFAKESAIKNENNEAQCQHARSQLAFAADYPFDADVCDSFNKKMCDIEFTHVDHAMESLSAPPQFKLVEHDRVVYKNAEYKEKTFQAPSYAQDEFPKDAFKPIENGTAWVVAGDEESSEGPNPSKASLNQVQDAWLRAQLLQHAAERVETFANGETCDIVPDTLPAPMTCLPNPARIVCEVAHKIKYYVTLVVLVAAEVAAEVLFYKFEKATEGPDGEVYANDASRKTYQNLKHLNEYLPNALQIINNNMKDQHMSMRQHLQDRHLTLETNIRRDVIESQNSLGRGIISAQNFLGEAVVHSRNVNGQAIVDARNANSDQHNAISKWLHENLCLIYTALEGTCTEFIGPLHEEQTFSPMVLSWPEGQPNIMDRLKRLDEAVAGIENTLTVGMSFEEKGNADQGFESAEADFVEGNVDAMEARLGAMQDAMHSQMDELKGVVNSKMRDAEDKMDLMEKRMEDMENKIDDVRNKMDEMTDLISRVMQQNMKVIEALA